MLMRMIACQEILSGMTNSNSSLEFSFEPKISKDLVWQFVQMDRAQQNTMPASNMHVIFQKFYG